MTDEPEQRICIRGHKCLRGVQCRQCAKVRDTPRLPCSEPGCKNLIRRAGHACRSCYSRLHAPEIIKRFWATPTYVEKQRTASRQRANPPMNAWSPEEDAIIRSLAGIEWPEEIGRRCCEVSSNPRSLSTIRQRARALGVSLERQGWVRGDVARIFGVDGVTVQGWIDGGLLEAARWGSVLMCSNQEQINAFIRAYPWLYDVDRMVRGPFRSLAEVVQKRDPWWSFSRACRETGMSRNSMATLLRRGVIEARRRRGAHGGEWMFRAMDLADVQERYTAYIAKVTEIRKRNMRPGGVRKVAA